VFLMMVGNGLGLRMAWVSSAVISFQLALVSGVDWGTAAMVLLVGLSLALALVVWWRTMRYLTGSSPRPKSPARVVCPSCGYQSNLKEFRFCGRCGVSLEEGTKIY
jgi:uncharacterized paraquat-inducible protein A